MSDSANIIFTKIKLSKNVGFLLFSHETGGYKQFAGFGNPAKRERWRATSPVLNRVCKYALLMGSSGKDCTKNFMSGRVAGACSKRA